ncbi:MAG: ABC transporter substrate-binding protein [Betaproteobacteria bacterium]|nr:MAG: ABC transporter substrate-binding protein [Betaproteobacteria bacterium]TMH34232.1 MAG: ABC transporter substrate-binding protein [Betaproteobacteria bacterium]
MKLKSLALGATIAAAGIASLVTSPAFAQAKEQFVPVMSYRTGPYAPNGVPIADGFVDYLKLVNAKGGINGVKIMWEECEFGYATDRAIECYERLKGKGPTGAAAFDLLSTGAVYAITAKTATDKIPLIHTGYGRADSADGGIFKWNFPLLGTYWTAADALIQHIGKKEGGLDKLKGKKIALVYHDSPFGKEPIQMLQERAKMHGFELLLLPVTAPGVEQKSTWLQVRQQRPDYLLLWGWGVMNSTALKEAVATGYPREKMYGVWWSGSEPDVKGVEEGAKGYNSLVLDYGQGRAKVHEDLLKLVYDKGQGTAASKDEVGSVLHTRGMMISMLITEAIKQAQTVYGKKPLTGEQVRWGFENLALDQKKLDAIGFTGVMKPVSTSCVDHMGSSWARVHTWDGAHWKLSSDWIEADQQIIKPLVKASADKFAAANKLTRRTAEDCSPG